MLLEGQLGEATEFSLPEEEPLEAEDSPEDDDPPPLQEIMRRLK